MRAPKFAFLEDGKVIPHDDLLKWAEWYETADRGVALAILLDCTVSTVFLALDHSVPDKEPLWFETLVSGGEHDGEMERYSTLEEAMLGHERMVARVKDYDDG